MRRNIIVHLHEFINMERGDSVSESVGATHHQLGFHLAAQPGMQRCQTAGVTFAIQSISEAK